MEPIIQSLMTRKAVHRVPGDPTSKIVNWVYEDNFERDMMNAWSAHAPLASTIISVH